MIAVFSPALPADQTGPKPGTIQRRKKRPTTFIKIDEATFIVDARKDPIVGVPEAGLIANQPPYVC
jgi:hypothetical protein